MTIYDMTELKEATKNNPRSPCKDCQVGYSSYSTFIDKKTRHEMVEIIHCQDTCQRLKNYLKEMNVKK